MRKNLLAGLFFAVLAAALLWCGSASARGTRFMLEGALGLGMADDSGSSTFWSAALGYGGKFRGFPPRFYLLVAWDQAETSSDLTATVSSATREVTDQLLLFGPRIYLPLSSRARIYFQALLGPFWSESDWLVNGVEQYRPEQDRGVAGKFSAGFQFRPAPFLSIGVGVDRVVLWGKENEPAAAMLTGLSNDAADSDQTRFGANVALHF